MEKIEFDTEALITRAEAIILLKCTSPTFWRFTKSKKISYYRVGRRMLFKRSEILKTIKINCI